jgi:CelD/BcsL family acetyltransferase involved in cellulose biosynthesis
MWSAPHESRKGSPVFRKLTTLGKDEALDRNVGERAAREYSRELLRDAAAVDAAAREWNDLPQAQDNPLLTADWYGAAAHSLDASIEILTVRRHGALVGVAPLGVDKRAGVSRLQPLGVRALHEPSGFSYRDVDALEALCESLIDRRRPFILQRMPWRGPSCSALARAAQGRGVFHELATPSAPIVKFAGDGDVAAFEARLSSRRRQDYRRARRGLERRGAVSFEMRTPTRESVAADLEEAMRIEAASWKSRGGTTILRTGKLREFFHEYAARLAAKGHLRIAFLRVGGVGIAMQLIVEHAAKFWIHKVGYDEEWADHSPGVQIMWDVIRHACASRLAGVELLGKIEPWLNIWTNDTRQYRTLIFYPFNAHGLAAAAADAVHAATGKLRGRLRA